MVAVAIGGAALIGGATQVISGNKAASATKNAAAATDATNRYIFDTTRADYAPYRTVGNNALGKLADLYGVGTGGGTDWEAYVRADPAAMRDWQMYHSGGGPVANPNAVAGSPAAGGDLGTNFLRGALRTGATASAPAMITPDNMTLAEYGQYHWRNDGGKRDLTPYQAGSGTGTGAGNYGGFEASPGYQFRMDEAMKAIERSAAARGNLNSGATMDALQRRAQGVASSEFENYANRLASLAGVGQSATGAVAQAGQNYAQQQGATNMAAGQARASAYANTGNAINNTVQNMAGMYLYGQGFGGGGGGAATPPYAGMRA
jgi:hypothetical protein